MKNAKFSVFNNSFALNSEALRMLKSKEIQINETNARNVFSETIINKKFDSNFLNQVKQDSHHKETFSYILLIFLNFL